MISVIAVMLLCVVLGIFIDFMSTRTERERIKKSLLKHASEWGKWETDFINGSKVTPRKYMYQQGSYALRNFSERHLDPKGSA